MSEITDAVLVRPEENAALAVVPTPRCEVSVREAVASDIGFIDQLQKMHSHMVGFLPFKALEKRIAAKQAIIAEAPHSGGHAPEPVGYCIAHDQYMRDDVGIVYQLNVLPLKQRHLVGATLIKAVFERAAYGCKLFSCWCAQDLQANFFWESIGFVPLGFRTGSRAKQRIQIFWQRRVRDDDQTTPYWFPSKTEGGAVAEDRIALPIPPGTHWRDAKPVLLPGLPAREADAPKLLPGGAPVRTRPEAAGGAKVSHQQRMQVFRSQSKHLQGCPPGKAAVFTSGGRVKYVDRADAPSEEELAPPKPKRTPKPRMKHESKYEVAARELRDRYLEAVNRDAAALLPPAAHGKYDVSRQIAAGGPASKLKQTPPPHLLNAA